MSRMPEKKPTQAPKDEAFETELAARREAAESGSQHTSPIEEVTGSVTDAETAPVPAEAPPASGSPSEDILPAAVARPIPPDEMTVAHNDDENAVYRAMDRLDEIAIIEEIEGRMSEVLVYSVSKGGRKIEDLSWPGVREAIRMLVERTGRNIRIGAAAPVIERYSEHGIDYVRVMAYAEDPASGQGFWGTAEEPRRMVLTSESAIKKARSEGRLDSNDSVRDDYAESKALSKAQRNALKYFIPEQIRQAIIALSRNDKKRLREIIVGPGAPAIEGPAPLDDDRGKNLIKACNDTYREICRANREYRTKVPPGAFNSRLRQAWSNHDALEALLAAIQDEAVKDAA